MIREAITADFNFIFLLYMHPSTNPYLLYDPMDEISFDPIFNDLLDKKLLFVYENDGEAIGMCKLVPQPHRNAHTVYLGGVAVHPSYSGKGYGSKMMKDIIEYAGANGYKRIELSTAIHNEAAIRLYEKYGFKREGVLKKYTWFKNENIFWDEVMMAYLF